MTTFAVIGAGGIGYFLAPLLTRLLSYTYSGTGTVPELYIVDGDVIETKNLARVYTNDALGLNKASVLADACSRSVESGSVEVRYIPNYIDPDNYHALHRVWHKDGVTIFSCVDNNKSRAYLEDLAAKLSNSNFISGGNSFDEGQVHIFAKRNNRNLCLPIKDFAGDIRDDKRPENEFPSKRSCDVEYLSSPQIALTNSMVANTMLTAWWAYFRPGVKLTSGIKNEVLINLNTLDVCAFERKITEELQV